MGSRIHLHCILAWIIQEICLLFLFELVSFLTVKWYRKRISNHSKDLAILRLLGVQKIVADLNKQQECIPVGCVPPAAVAVMGGSPHPLAQPPPGAHIPPEQIPPLVWAWRHPPHPGCWPGDPPGQIPLNFPLGCGPGDPPGQIPSTSPLGVGLETCKVCWDTPNPHPTLLPEKNHCRF